MGLDMYLTAEKHVSGYSFFSDKEQNEFKQIMELTELNKLMSPHRPSGSVSVTAAYWRKANAIHGWFVNNVQNGEDECKKHYVSREQLQKLIDTAKEALEFYEVGEKEKARDLLPPTEGFFFGGTEIGDWFAADLRDTIEQIEPLLLQTPDNIDFYYQSTW